MQGRLDESMAVMQPELERDDPDARLLDQAGWVRQKAQDWAAARELYRRALAGAGLDPASAQQTRTRLAMVLERLGDPAGAREQHDLAVSSGHSNAGAYFERGMFLLRQGRTREAVRDLQESARLDPGWPAPRQVLDSLRRGDPGAR
jgi:tetratricopeptide (TPR) repeat protein